MLLELLGRAVLARVAHRVAAEAVGAHLDQRRLAVRARALDGLGEAIAHLEDVLDEEAVARHAVAERLLRHVLDAHRPRERRAHRVLVVLADEDDGQLPERGQAHALVEVADADGALAEEDDGDPVLAAVLRREGGAGRDRDVAADDAVAAEHVVLLVEEVHRAAEAPRAAGDLAEELGHGGARAHPARERHAVIAVGREQVVVGPERGGGADRDRLLPDVEVEEAADLALRVGARRLFLEAADGGHLR